MKKPKVAIIFTGGTISMTIDEKIGAAIPSLSGNQILSMVTNIDKLADIETIEYCEIPGPGSLTLYPIRICPKALQQAYFFVKFSK